MISMLKQCVAMSRLKVNNAFNRKKEYFFGQKITCFCSIFSFKKLEGKQVIL